MRHSIAVLLLSLVQLQAGGNATAADKVDRESAIATVKKAVGFYRENVSVEGGSVYAVSTDLTKREGEEKVGPREAWIQPPATPSVGMMYLRGWQLTGETVFKDALLETCSALIRGQLESGGWGPNIELDPLLRSKYAYRVDHRTTIGKRFNRTTFDDNKSQSALLCLMLADKELGFQNAAIHEAALYALEAFVNTQYANGAWPQRYSEPSTDDDRPVLNARYPKSWNRTYERIDYNSFYTLNDNTVCDLIDLMLTAYAVYQDERWLKSAKRGGEFLLLAQLPEPQPGWAQQYNLNMEPAWARKFEPPAITGSESQKVIATLLTLFEETSDQRYLAPVPRAIEYYQSLTLDDGRLARFYELGTDKPLYFTTDYKLVYTDDDLPTHYGFKVRNKFDRLQQWYERAKDKTKANPRKVESPSPRNMSDSVIQRASDAVNSLDERGAWVEQGSLRHAPQVNEVVATRTYIERTKALADFISAKR